MREGVKFKRMGVQPGVPDICIPVARSSHHGLYIELKRRSGGRTSDNQKYWIDLLKGQGYAVYIAEGAAELIKIVTNYMEGKL